MGFMLKVSNQQKLFVAEYQKDLNAKQAAIRAGYSPRTAEQQGWKLLNKPHVMAALKNAMNQRAIRTQVTSDMVVTELSKIAFSDMKDYVAWGPLGVTFVNSDDITESMSAAVCEVTENVTEHGRAVKFKLHDKKGALDSLAKHLGMFNESDPRLDQAVQITRVTVVLPPPEEYHAPALEGENIVEGEAYVFDE
jgi:phage terminase small subunit